jgi:signal transduction histidine kinase
VDKLPRVFEAYYSTKERGRGTGLGLYVSSLIAHLHYGALQFRSSDAPDDHGTRVRLLLPAHGEG